MGNLLKYKGFSGSVEISCADNCVYGKIECINDLITYESDTVSGLQSAFEESVNDYLETCRELGKEADKPMSGSFNIRIGSELHKKSYLKAKGSKISLNDFVKNAIQEKLESDVHRSIHFHFNDSETERTNVFSIASRKPISVKSYRNPVH